jgi:hypothetical protein
VSGQPEILRKHQKEDIMEKSVYEQLSGKSGPFIESYHEDLTRHDRRWLKENPGTPFLHFTGETGTHLVAMISPEKYPVGRVKYLFGHASKREILGSEMSVVHDMEKRYGRGDLAMYYDGEALREISYEKASEIARAYVRKTRQAWGAIRCD